MVNWPISTLLGRRWVLNLKFHKYCVSLTIFSQNCAFVDFKTADGYQKAVDGNPHKLGDDTFYVEERRVRPGSTPYVPRGNYQGGRGGRGGGMQGAPRGNFQSNRGGFTPRGRGGAPGGRGRGGAQDA